MSVPNLKFPGWFRWALALAVVLLPTVAARAQDATAPVDRAAPIAVALTPPPYEAGSVISATLIVEGDASTHQIALAGISDFEAKVFDAAPLAPAAGRTGYLFRLNLLPLKAGRLRLPALEITGPEGRRTTEPLTIEVGEPVPAPDMTLQTTLSEATCYVGQPLTLEVVWLLAADIDGIYAVDMRVPMLEHPDFKNRDFWSQPSGLGKPVGLPVNRTRAIGGFAERTIRFQKIIVPQKSGTFVFPASTVLCSLVRETPPEPGAPPKRNPRNVRSAVFQYAEYFDNQFFSSSTVADVQRVYVRGDSLKLEVRPLPPEGRPANFSAIVGAFSLGSGIDPATVHQGEPFTLTLHASQYAYPEVLDLPGLASLPGFESRFNIPAERAVPEIRETDDGREKIFRQSLRAVSTGVDKIPALAISYFDPATATYSVATAPEITLHVLPGSVANGSDAILSDGARLRNLLVSTENAIGPNFSGRDLARSWGAACIESAAFTGLALGLPPALYAWLMVATRRHRCRRRDPRLERMRWAYADFVRATRGAHAPDVLARAVRVYLGRRLDVGVVTFGSVEPLLRARGIAERDLSQLRAFLETQDRREYSARAAGFTTGESVRGLVRSIESALVRPSGGATSRHLPEAIVMLALLGAIAVPVPALPAAPAESPLTETETWFQAGLRQHFDDPIAAQDAYRKAAAGYEYGLQSGGPTLDAGKLHFNAGCARFFAEDLGRAVYHFRVAQHLSPGDPRIREALAFARERQPDELKPASARKFWRWLTGWREAIDPAWRKLLLAATSVLFWGLLGVEAFRPSRTVRRLLRVSLLAALALGLWFGADAFAFRIEGQGVIVDSEVIARTGPATVYEPAYQAALHGGMEFCVVGKDRDWLKVMISGVEEPCWIPGKSAALFDGGNAARPPM